MIIRKDVIGLQNVEKYLTDEVFKKVGKHDLEDVQIDGNELVLYFSEEENPSAKNFVKQVSAEKDPELRNFYSKAPQNWCLLSKKKIGKIFLLFFSEKNRKQEHDYYW